jgi:K+-sensing histidine kinase KdpD
MELDIDRPRTAMAENTDHDSKLLALAVHELRTPLSVVSGYLRLLLLHYGGSMPDQQRTLVELGEKSCGALATMLEEADDLAAFAAGKRPLRREPLRLVTLLDEAATAVREGRDRGLTFEVRAGAPDVWLSGDAARLAAAFTTLATAVLRERADPALVQAACRVVGTPENRRVRIAFANAAAVDEFLDGPDDVALDEYRGGLGFSLLLASRVLAAHGGRVGSPVSDRGRLVLVASLPLMPAAPHAG